METEFAQLMSTIWKSERALDVLYRKAADLRKLLQSPNRIRSGISVLPFEVLGMIFRELKGQSNTHTDGQPSLSELSRTESSLAAARPELLLSHVSKYWRAVALGIPSLWTRIYLYINQSADLVELYLTRSRGLPLDVVFRQHFICGIHPHQVLAEDYLRITATILSHMHVCRGLEIRTNVTIPGLFEGLSRSNAPLLTKMIIHHPRGGMQEPALSFSSFPALTHVEFGVLISIATTLPNITITSLTLSGLPTLGLPATALLDLLRRLQSLSHLALLDEVVDFDRSQASGVVELLSLRSLTLKPGPDIPRTYLTGLLEMVVTPVLEELILDFTNVSSSRELHPFSRYLQREAPRFLPLRHVTIGGPFEGSDLASALVHAAPNIQSLSLSRYSMCSVLKYLTHDARRGAFPELHALQFESPHLDWDIVLSFLCRRKQMGRPLHSLQFEGFGGSTSGVLDGPFRSLLDACLTV